MQLPDATSAERTLDTLTRVESLTLGTPGVRSINSIAGNSFQLGARASNFCSMFIILEEFDKRHSPETTAAYIQETLLKKYAKNIPEATVTISPPPAVSGLGRAGGIKLKVRNRDGRMVPLGAVANVNTIGGPLMVTRYNMYPAAAITANISPGVSSGEGIQTLEDVALRELPGTMAAEWTELAYLERTAGSVPLSGFMNVKPVTGPLMIIRHNLYQAAFVNADAAPGASSGEAIQALKDVADRNLGVSMRAEYTALAFLQQLAGNTAMYAFLLAVVLVFLVLAAQYESWALPLAVILVVPMCLLCSVVGVIMAGMDINIFTQIGFVVLVGLACKNAILIVEYARARNQEGVSVYEATLDACRLRLRPIIMTSFAFIFGVVPLVLGEGAGADMRRTLGTAVFAGMLGVTLFGILLAGLLLRDPTLRQLANCQDSEGVIGDVVVNP